MKSITKHIGAQQATPYPISRLSPSITVSDIIRSLEDNNKTLASVVNGKLQVIVKQIEQLQSEAFEILKSAQRDVELHNIPCSFVKRSGNVYHVYQREDGTKFFSILSPNDWGNMIPGKLEGSYHLESDMSWRDVKINE